MESVKIIGILLAAGKSSRMGTNKLSLPLGKTTVGSTTLNLATQSFLDYILVVTKEQDPLDWIETKFWEEPLKKRWTAIPCEHAAKGQSQSLIAGIRKARELSADAVIILLADQPFLQVAIVNHLIFHYKKHRQEFFDFVTANFDGINRPPALFSKKVFPHLSTLKGDVGAQKIIRDQPNLKGMAIKYEDEQSFFDIDTVEDYQKIQKEGVFHEYYRNGGKSLDANRY